MSMNMSPRSANGPRQTIGRQGVPGGDTNVTERLRRRVLIEAQQEGAIERREDLFRTFVADRLVERFEEDLYEADFSAAEVREILSSDAVEGFTHEQLFRALCYPYDSFAKKNFFSRLRQKLTVGELATEEVLPYLARLNQHHKRGIGFHTSPRQILPTRAMTKQGADETWGFRGREIDHRDNDEPRAYYSRSFKHLFWRGVRNYLYIVSASDTDKSDGRWWRAPSLSIIAEIPVDELNKAIADMEAEVLGERDANEGVEQVA